jgi:hypothetical protein
MSTRLRKIAANWEIVYLLLAGYFLLTHRSDLATLMALFVVIAQLEKIIAELRR